MDTEKAAKQLREQASEVVPMHNSPSNSECACAAGGHHHSSGREIFGKECEALYRQRESGQGQISCLFSLKIMSVFYPRLRNPQPGNLSPL